MLFTTSTAYEEGEIRFMRASHNKPMQRADHHKMLGRGRSSSVVVRVWRARVLNRLRAVADGSR
jgi:hypothetical protein